VQPLIGVQSERNTEEFIMNKSEQEGFDKLSRKRLRDLKLQGKSDKTINAYSSALRWIAAWFDCCPKRLEHER